MVNWWLILAAGLLAGATTCAVTQGGLLVGLIATYMGAAISLLVMKGKPVLPLLIKA